MVGARTSWQCSGCTPSSVVRVPLGDICDTVCSAGDHARVSPITRQAPEGMGKYPILSAAMIGRGLFFRGIPLLLALYSPSFPSLPKSRQCPAKLAPIFPWEH